MKPATSVMWKLEPYRAQTVMSRVSHTNFTWAGCPGILTATQYIWRPMLDIFFHLSERRHPRSINLWKHSPCSMALLPRERRRPQSINWRRISLCLLFYVILAIVPQ